MTLLRQARVRFAFTMAGAALAALAAVPSALAAYPGDDGMIAFNSNRDYGDEVGIRGILPDGSDDHLIFEPESFEPEWSPDGRQIVYMRELTYDAYEIVVAGADGSEPRTVKTLRVPGGPSFTPNGREILYTATNYDVRTNNQLRQVRLDGTNDRRVFRSKNDGSIGSARYSPDGKRIVLAGVPDGDRPGQNSPGGIWTMRPDGSGMVRLARGGQYSPDYSSDGKYILFHRHAYKGATTWTMRADGSRVDQVGAGEEVGSAAWAPSGNRLVAVIAGPSSGIYGPGCSNLVTMKRGGGDRTWITDYCAYGAGAGDPAWQPLPPG